MSWQQTTIGRTGVAAAFGAFFVVSGLAQKPSPIDLTDASLDELANIQVTSVSKKEQSLSKTGAAVFVITHEDIRRSGATNIPDLLRMAPGVDVAQIDANTFAISIRGFNDRLADKVLVLEDGRTVYTPTTSGVYWDQVNVPLEDIDRIEVIRGPGGTVWGANAVNGVINIITMSSKDTDGVLLRAGGGSQDTANGLAQFGGKIGQDGAYRLFEDYANTGNLRASDGTDKAADGWHKFDTGFRSDWTLSPRDTMTIQGDALETGEGQTISVVFVNALPLSRVFNDSVSVDEIDILGRWKHTFKDASYTSLQIYYDQYHRHDEGVRETLRTVDFDFQYNTKIASRNDVVWGLGYRSTDGNDLPGYGKSYAPPSFQNNLATTFIQDEISVTDSISLTLGSKFERQPYVGFQYEPSAQLVWSPTSRRTVWVSAARAIRETSREEEGLQIYQYTFALPGNGFGVSVVNGDHSVKPERLYDVEAGYRDQLTKRVSLDLAAYSSHYKDFVTLDAGEPYFTAVPAPQHLVLPFFFGNTAGADTYGAEFSANWDVTDRWRLTPVYSGIHMDVVQHPGGQSTSVAIVEDNTPESQAHIRSLFNVTPRLEWDSSVYYVGRLRDSGYGAVPAYTRVDTRMGWRVSESLDLSLVGQNLLSPRHAEFHDAYEVRRTLVERSVYAKLTYRF